jgi:hypothetical protein
VGLGILKNTENMGKKNKIIQGTKTIIITIVILSELILSLFKRVTKENKMRDYFRFEIIQILTNAIILRTDNPVEAAVAMQNMPGLAFVDHEGARHTGSKSIFKIDRRKGYEYALAG